jgi:hypothetical protein
VDEFFSDRSYTFWRQCANNKFSYLFEYPYNSDIKKIRIQDSIYRCDEPSVLEQKSLINAGIRETARLFTYSINQNAKNDTIIKSTNDTIYKKNDIDSINLIPARVLDYKNGVLFNYYFGQKTNFGFLLSYLEMFHRPKNKGELGYGYAFQYNKIKNNDIEGSMYGFLSNAILRYNFSEELNGIFLDGGITFIFGREEAGINNYNFFIGGRIEESIGYYLSRNIAFNVGLYQIGLWGSKLLPTDIGFVFSLSITSDY